MNFCARDALKDLNSFKWWILASEAWSHFHAKDEVVPN